MNIFIFCGPLAFGKGGMEKVATNLANHLSKKNVVTLGYFVRANGDKPAYSMDKSVILAPWFKSLSNSREEYSKRIVESLPDIFIYFGASSQALQVISLLENYSVPIMMHEGSNPYRVINDSWSGLRGISRLQATWEREALYSQASLVRFTMPEYLDSLPFSIRKFAVAYPNAFDLPDVCSNVKINKRIINIGGLKPNKNIVPLLNICANLFEKFPEWQLHIFSAVNKSPVGSEYVNEIKRLVNYKGLANNVFLNVEVDDLDSEYKASGIHVITSLSEGLSNAVAESMTYGIPTVGIAGVPGVDGLVRHNRNGILIERADIEKNLLEALSRLMSLSELREDLGRTAREDAHFFEPLNIYRKWEEAIKLCLENHGKKKSELYRHYRRVLPSLYKEAVPGFKEGKECSYLHEKLFRSKEVFNKKSAFDEKEVYLEQRRWVDV